MDEGSGAVEWKMVQRVRKRSVNDT